MKWNNLGAIASLLAAALCAGSASAASIAWVSFHAADNTPSAGAVTAGATTAPDKGYTDLLTSFGHTVTRIVSTDNAPPAGLAAHDIVIISRSGPSTHYETDAETAAWNSLNKPVIILGGYITRNNRLGQFNGTTIPDTTGDVKLNAVQPGHPIFTGVVLSGGVMVTNFATPVMFNGTVPQRGISTVTEAAVPGGQVIATINGAGANGNASIVYFPAGTTMINTGNDDVLGGRRLVFLTGSREHDAAVVPGNPPSSSEIAGIYDLTPIGAHMLLNAVTFMQNVPEPSSAGLAVLAMGGLGLLRRRNG